MCVHVIDSGTNICTKKLTYKQKTNILPYSSLPDVKTAYACLEPD